tara:strand:- start:400 stop:888 length:489 start_codon:yes stop_codon:yes gene_type:complete
MNPKQIKLLNKINNIFIFKIGSILKLPLAFLTGLRILNFDSRESLVRVNYNYLNKNPFKSTYFAVLSMAAELSTGLYALLHTTGLKPSCAFILIGMKANFIKKASGVAIFSCNDGEKIKTAVNKCAKENIPIKVNVKSRGNNEKGELIAEFEFIWSFKQRSN